MTADEDQFLQSAGICGKFRCSASGHGYAAAGGVEKSGFFHGAFGKFSIGKFSSGKSGAPEEGAGNTQIRYACIFKVRKDHL